MISNLLLKLKGLNENKFVECIVGQPFTKEELKILQELVDKETPKKTEYKYISKEREYIGSDAFHFIKVVHGDCPICGENLSEDKKYCPECGQKLDWSEEE